MKGYKILSGSTLDNLEIAVDEFMFTHEFWRPTGHPFFSAVTARWYQSMYRWSK